MRCHNERFRPRRRVGDGSATLQAINYNDLDPDELRSLLGAIDTLGEITASHYPRPDRRATDQRSLLKEWGGEGTSLHVRCCLMLRVGVAAMDSKRGQRDVLNNLTKSNGTSKTRRGGNEPRRGERKDVDHAGCPESRQCQYDVSYLITVSIYHKTID
jgi:hypothetical protein